MPWLTTISLLPLVHLVRKRRSNSSGFTNTCIQIYDAVPMDRKSHCLTPIAETALGKASAHLMLCTSSRWGFRQSVHSITAAPTSEKDDWTGEVLGRPAVSVMSHEGIVMAKRSIIVAFGLSFLLLALGIFLARYRALKKQSFPNAAVQITDEPNASLPPGFWIQYDPVTKRHTPCYSSYGVNSCWHSFKTREDAIRDAQFFANYLKRTGTIDEL